MTNLELSNALKQAIQEEFQDISYPCVHSSRDVWGQEAIVGYFEENIYQQLRSKLETYRVSLPVDENSDLKAVARQLAQEVERVEQEAYEQALSKWSHTYPTEALRGAIVCHELCDWSLLMDENGGVIQHGKVLLAHYATYLPNVTKVKEFQQSEEQTNGVH